jgi:hypothetical protein
MRPPSPLLAAVLVLALPLGLAAAQEAASPAPPLVSGARVRVHAHRIFIGTLVTLDTATLVLQDDALLDTLRVPVGSIGRLEVSTGQRSGAGRGAEIGLIAGASAGAIIGLAVIITESIAMSSPVLWEGCPRDAIVCFGPEAIFLSAAVLGAAGAGLGALIGALSPIDRWEQVPVRPVEIGIVPLEAHRLGVGVSIGF